MNQGMVGVFVAALVVVPSVARAQYAPQPYPQQPYPQQPYPQQPYPSQPYPSQPYPSQPYPQQPYPQQPYPQQPYPQQPPINPAKQEPRYAGFGVSGVLGAAFGRAVVDQGPEWRTFSGGVLLHGLTTGFHDFATGRARLTAQIGGGGGGAEAAYAGELYVGVGVPLSESSQLHLRIGVDAVGLKNDEIEATTGELPGVQLGWGIWTNGIGFELGGKGGVVPRTEYEPGDEMQGRRYWRRFNTELDYGAYGSLVSTFFTVSGSYRRMAHEDPLTVVEGNACLHFVLALCAVGQQWKGQAFGPTGGALSQLGTKDITTTYLGFAIGIGGSKTEAATPLGLPKTLSGDR
jgi:hypothetical protein